MRAFFLNHNTLLLIYERYWAKKFSNFLDALKYFIFCAAKYLFFPDIFVYCNQKVKTIFFIVLSNSILRKKHLFFYSNIGNIKLGR